MANIALKDGKVILKDGKASCTCCGSGSVCECLQDPGYTTNNPDPNDPDYDQFTVPAGSAIKADCGGGTTTAALVCWSNYVAPNTCECLQDPGYTTNNPDPNNPDYDQFTVPAGAAIKADCGGGTTTVALTCWADIGGDNCECLQDPGYTTNNPSPGDPNYDQFTVPAGSAVKSGCGGGTTNAALTCWAEIQCDTGSATISASRGARISLGVTVTDEKNYLTITSSGDIDLICADYWNGGTSFRDGGTCGLTSGVWDERCSRPNAPFTAPAQLQIYVGGTLLSEGQNFNGQTSLRGDVTARIRDSGYYDNCGSYSVSATLCPQ